MRVIDILTSPWAIVPEKLYEIQEIYGTHLRGEKIDISAVEALIKDPSATDAERRYEIIDGVAFIPIQGVIAKRMNLFSRISGGVSTQLVGQDIKEALDDEGITGIILDIDSPGGTVDGTEELANIIYEGRDKKPIITYSDGLMASAAVWIGSAAHEIYISGATVEVGSIGVVSTHVDYSEYEKKLGIKTTEIYSGKYKRIVSQYRPLSEEGEQTMQDLTDYVYTVFVDVIAKHRGTDSETVLKDMADGRIFIGQQAVNAGLVDGIMGLDAILKDRLPVLQAEMAERREFLELQNNFSQRR